MKDYETLHRALATPAFLGWLLTGLFLLSLSVPVQALTVDTLYEASVAVSDQSEEERRRATQQAMRVVLVKLSGNSRAPVLPGASRIVRTADEYVAQYQFERARDVTLSEADGEQLRLRVRFDAEYVNGAMADAGLSRWSNERPETLTWLFVRGDGKWTPVAKGSVDPLHRLVLERADTRGIPIVFPNYDYLDAEALNAEALATDPFRAVVNASGRYNSNALLYGTISQATPEIWEADWRFVVSGETLTWRGQSGFPELLIEEGLDEVADALASRYAGRATAGSVETIEIQVNGIDLPDDYARVVEYFRQLDAISDLNVASVTQNRAGFVLGVRGGLREFDRLITLGRTLEAVGGSPGQYLILH